MVSDELRLKAEARGVEKKELSTFDSVIEMRTRFYVFTLYIHISPNFTTATSIQGNLAQHFNK